MDEERDYNQLQDRLTAEIEKLKSTLAFQVDCYSKREKEWQKAQDQLRAARDLAACQYFEIQQLRKERGAWSSLARLYRHFLRTEQLEAF